MRGHNIYNTAFALRAAGDALHEAGRPFEILAFTTRLWKGGNSRQDWLDQGRQQQPGRLNDLLHIVVKAMDEPWEDTRQNMTYLLSEGLLKENIDGEALAWARTRIQERGQGDVLIPVSDGVPLDDSTLTVNHMEYLKDHLCSEEAALVAHGVPTQKIFIGKDAPQSDILPEAVHITPKKGTQAFVDGVAEACQRALEPTFSLDKMPEKMADEMPEP